MPDSHLADHRQQSKLREHGLSVRRKLLLAGPPGCGKTMTSKALAKLTPLVPLRSVEVVVPERTPIANAIVDAVEHVSCGRRW